jgi:chromosome segregation ATPase
MNWTEAHILGDIEAEELPSTPAERIVALMSRIEELTAKFDMAAEGWAEATRLIELARQQYGAEKSRAEALTEQLEQLVATNEALTAERDEHWKSFVHWRKEADDLTEQLEAARADAKEAEAERDQATIALMHLERCAQVVAERGAQIGPQWTRLTVAILKAREAMSKLPTPSRSSEPALVQSSRD